MTLTKNKEVTQFALCICISVIQFVPLHRTKYHVCRAASAPDPPGAGKWEQCRQAYTDIHDSSSIYMASLRQTIHHSPLMHSLLRFDPSKTRRKQSSPV